MRTALIAMLTLVLSIGSFAQDTTWVQTFTFDSISTRRANYTFPSELDTMRFEKVLMYYKLKCDPATPWDQYNCGEWDYLTYTRVFDHTGEMDSLQVDSVQYLHNYESTPVFDYEPWGYNYTNLYDVIENDRTGASTVLAPVLVAGVTSSLYPFDMTKKGGRFQMLLTAAELNAAGVSAGDIQSLALYAANITGPGELFHPSISLKATTNATITSFHQTGFTEVYNLSRDGVVAPAITLGENEFVFYQPFNWNGTDNIIVDISFDNGVQPTTLMSFDKETSPVGMAVNYPSKNGVLNFTGSEHALLELSDIDLGGEVTISFWAKGNGNTGVNTSILEGYDTLNNRVINIHMPWSNNRIYWDCGAGSGYDRIDQDISAAGIDNEWHHWAFTKNEGTGVMNIYRDGALWHTGTGKNNTIGDLHRLVIGANRSLGNNWKGKIDEFQVYNVEVDAAAIASWYNQKLTVLHPNWNDLLVYYKFDEDKFASDASNNDYLMMPSSYGLFDFSERPVVGDQIDVDRPLISFGQGAVTGAIEDVTVHRAEIVEPQVVFEFQQVNHHFEIVNAFIAAPAGSEVVYDVNEVEVSSTPYTTSSVLNNQTITYYEEPYEIIHNVEIGRFITPYGIQFDLGSSGFTWVYDVTDYQQYLHGLVDLAAHNTQELIDLRFAFIEGIPPRDVHNREPIWSDYTSHTYANMDNDVVLNAIDVPLSDTSSMFKIKTRFTGHGHNGSNNCCEWGFGAGRDHEILVDGVSRFNWEIWEETACGDNPNVSQGGTWPYAREGWCPGDLVKEYDHELTSFVTPGTSVELDYDITDIPANDLEQGNGNYIVAMDLISYGAPNFQYDAAVIDILNPNSWEYYRKWNPSCQNPRIIIQNTGEQPLTSARISVWVDYNNKFHYDWTGNLEFLEKEVVEIPINDISFWYDPGGSNTFSAHIDYLNESWTADEYENNNNITLPFKAPNVVTGDFLVWFTTNNKAHENQWRLVDGHGNTIFERTSLTNTTSYRDTFSLDPGCYSIILEDSDNDGISFWYSSQVEGETAGYFRLKYVGGWIFETFEQDFGNYNQFNFVVDENVGIQEMSNETSLEIFPNPGSGIVNVEFLGDSGGKASMVIRDVMGRDVLTKSMDVQSFAANANVDVSGLSTGTYFVTVTTQNGVYTKEFVKQ